jgi:hypothetical protein
MTRGHLLRVHDRRPVAQAGHAAVQRQDARAQRDGERREQERGGERAIRDGAAAAPSPGG